MTDDNAASRPLSIIDGDRYMTLATADADGVPWVSPVWYAPDGYAELLWVSSPGARHSRNLAARPELSIVIFDSRSRPAGQAVYISAHAALADPGRLPVFSERSVAQGMPAWPPLPGPPRLYHATATGHWMLGEDRDERVPVNLPDPRRAVGRDRLLRPLSFFSPALDQVRASSAGSRTGSVTSTAPGRARAVRRLATLTSSRTSRPSG